MTTIHDRPPTIAERLTSAANSSDLSVQIEQRGDVDYLIAAASTPARLGRYVYQLMSEWDGCAKPRAVTQADLEVIARGLPLLESTKMTKRGPRKVASLNLHAARTKHAEWLSGERRRILSRLQSMPRLMDAHSGFLPWVVARGVANPTPKLLDVLGWWADRRCLACEGTKEIEGRTCKTCKGIGHRPVPHGQEGLAISEHIAAHVDRARAGTMVGLKGMRYLKAYAAGKS